MLGSRRGNRHEGGTQEYEGCVQGPMMQTSESMRAYVCMRAHRAHGAQEFCHASLAPDWLQLISSA